MYRLLLPLTLVSSILSSPASAGQSALVTILAGTQVKMYVVGDASSRYTRPGDSFQAQAAHDVIVDRLVVVRKGAEGQGSIAPLQRTEGSARANGLVMVFDWVYAVDGTKVALTTMGQRAGIKAASQTARAPRSVAAFGMTGFYGIITVFVKGDTSVQMSTQQGDESAREARMTAGLRSSERRAPQAELPKRRSKTSSMRSRMRGMPRLTFESSL